jgi:hypothetical protein
MRNLLWTLVAFLLPVGFAVASSDNVEYSIFISDEYELSQQESSAIINNYSLIVNMQNIVSDDIVSNEEFQAHISDLFAKYAGKKRHLMKAYGFRDVEKFPPVLSNYIINDMFISDVLSFTESQFHSDQYFEFMPVYKATFKKFGDEEFEKNAAAVVVDFCDLMQSYGVAKSDADGTRELCSPEYVKRTEVLIKMKAIAKAKSFDLQYVSGELTEHDYFDYEEEFEKILRDDMLAALN